MKLQPKARDFTRDFCNFEANEKEACCIAATDFFVCFVMKFLIRNPDYSSVGVSGVSGSVDVAFWVIVNL